jgi:hypothetical protein
LENPGLAAKLTSAVGMPFDTVMSRLPAKWTGAVSTITRKALQQALRVALRTLDFRDRAAGSRNGFHKVLVAASGGIGGAFGLPALAAELPVTTVLMLRSIAAIARSEGEDLQAVETRLACLEVFALGGRTADDNAAESGYFAVRAILSRQISEAARYLLQRGVAEEGAPVLVRLMATIASRFGVTVSQKAAASAVPVIGAAGGALVNTIFMDHFQKMARGHFIVRRLERIYGAEAVQEAYRNEG